MLNRSPAHVRNLCLIVQLYVLAEDARAWHEAQAHRWPELRLRPGAHFRRWSGSRSRGSARIRQRRYRLPAAVRRG